MGDEFLTGYLTLAEGEKDPRNLMLAFAIARVLIIEFDIAKHIEVCVT
jgi:DNA repair/transcription protein MET18/MMS19